MMPSVNELVLTFSGVEYPTVFLPPSLPLSPEEREAYVEIREGHLPVVARVWMAASQYDAMNSGVKAGTSLVGIVMRGNSVLGDPITGITSQTVSKKTITFAPKFRIIDTHVIRFGLDGPIYEVILMSEQYSWWFIRKDRAFNILSEDKKSYIAGATDTSTPKTYADVVSYIAGQLGISPGALPFTPTAVPQNLSLRYAPMSEALSRILRPLGIVLCCNPYSTTAFSYSFKRLDYSVGDISNLISSMEYAGYEGSTSRGASSLANANFPAQVCVVFPKYPIDIPTSGSGTTAGRYTEILKDCPVAGTVTGTTDALFVGDHFDVADKTYTETLDDIATERGTCYYKRALIPHHTFVFSGGFAVTPGQQVRKVRLSMDCSGSPDDGWFTTITTHGIITRENAKRSSLASDTFLESDAAVSSVFPRDDGTIDIFGGSGDTLPEGSSDYQVLTWNNTSKTWSADWARWH